MTMLHRDNFNKACFHLEAAERTQAEIERLEREAIAKGYVQQIGRMQPSDDTYLPATLVASTILDTHEYKRLVSIRNAHQQQAQMYSLAHLAGLRATGNVLAETGEIRLPVRRVPEPRTGS